jgi:hypothetical protein
MASRAKRGIIGRQESSLAALGITRFHVNRVAWQAALAFVLSLLFLCGLIGWLQNVHIITGNGMYKSIQAEPWIADARNARLDPSNYLYFPLYGASARLLDVLGLWKGVPWKQFAYLNALWASLGVAAVYAFACSVSGSARVAALTSVFHLGCGFVLLLSVINEDIMPGYTLVLISMLLAGLWFAKPNYRRVAIVAVVFTFGWLIEWRLLFPTLPALVLALAIAEGQWRYRLIMIAVLFAYIIAVSGIVELSWEGHNGAVGLPDLLWTGKGIDSGWAGIGWGKAWMMLAGLGDYLFTFGAHIDPGSARQALLPLSISVLLQVVVLVACLVMLWPRRDEPRIRAIATVFLGTFVAGEVLNFYAQPQDPQMQVNVMAWLTVAWMLLLATTVQRRAFAVLAVLSLAPMVFNVASLARWRGGDADALRALAALEQQLPPDRTVFIYWGFEPIVTWQYAQWARSWDWDGKPNDSRFKWVALDAGAIRHPAWTPEQNAEALRRDLDAAFARGYRVVVSGVWGWSEAELRAALAGLSAADRASALHSMLHDNFEAKPVLDVASVGTYYELRPKTPR